MELIIGLMKACLLMGGYVDNSNIKNNMTVNNPPYLKNNNNYISK